MDAVNQKYIQNAYLTNKQNVIISNILPSVTISKSFWKRLSNRYSKSTYLTFIARTQHYSFQNAATQTIQNINYNYNKFVPHASLSFSNNQYGASNTNLGISYSENINYPTINQLAPLVDSSNVLYIPKGNLFLQPQKGRNISINYNYSSLTKNPVIVDANVNIGGNDNYITDSTIYGNNGRRTVYIVNLKNNQFIYSNASIRKSYQRNKNNTYQLSITTDFSYSQNPNYVNSIYNISKVSTSNTTLNAGYGYKDIFALTIEQGFSFYNSRQQGFGNNRFKNSVLSTMLSGSLQLPKNLNWSSNISLNRAKANGLDATDFAIWNASITYRFLKGNRGEAKFSALDLLKQNKGIINSVSGNTQSFGYSNVLQQYFMITLSYFPRKFGK